MTNLGLSSCSDVITCDQNWHHLNSNADLSNDAQIRVIGRMEPCTQMLKKLSGKLGSKISCHYTWMLHAKNYPSRWRFLRRFLTASKPSRRSITASKTREKEKKDGQKKIPKIEKPKDVGHNFDFCACPSHNAIKRDAGGKKGKLLCCKCIFDRI